MGLLKFKWTLFILKINKTEFQPHHKTCLTATETSGCHTGHQQPDSTGMATLKFIYCFSSFTSASPVSWTGYLPNAPNIPRSSSLPILLCLLELRSIQPQASFPPNKCTWLLPNWVFLFIQPFHICACWSFFFATGSLSSTGCPGTNNRPGWPPTECCD